MVIQSGGTNTYQTYNKKHLIDGTAIKISKQTGKIEMLIYRDGPCFNLINHVTLDSLSQFKIRVKNNLLPLLKEAHPELNNNYKKTIPFSDNWKVWNMEFTPNELQK